MSRLLLASATILLCACANQHIGAPAAAAPVPVENTYTVRRDVTFTPERWPQKLLADIYIPDLQPPKAGFPAVILIHGGAWARGDREQVVSLAERISQRGYVVMSITYRFAPDYLFPTQVEDTQQALRWLQQNAKAQQVDATRIAAWGYSAGAHLAALLADLSPGDAHYAKLPRVKALVAGGTPADLRKYTAGYLVPRFLGKRFSEDPELYAEASPIVYVSKDDPPTFLYHGTADDLVKPDHATDYKAALDAAGIQNELFLIGGHGHFSAFYFDDEAVQAGLAFLDRKLKPRG